MSLWAQARNRRPLITTEYTCSISRMQVVSLRLLVIAKLTLRADHAGSFARCYLTVNLVYIALFCLYHLIHLLISLLLASAWGRGIFTIVGLRLLWAARAIHYIDNNFLLQLICISVFLVDIMRRPRSLAFELHYRRSAQLLVPLEVEGASVSFSDGDHITLGEEVALNLVKAILLAP